MEVAKKKAIHFYLSLHVNFHLSTDETFLTNPHAVLNTNVIEVYNSSEVHNALNSTHRNLVSAIEDFQQRRSGWVLNKLLALDLHLLEFNSLPTSPSSRGAKQDKHEMCFYCLLLLVYMEILMKTIMSVYPLIHNTRKNLTLMVFHSKWH